MQLGTRWRFGGTPPNRLSEPMRESVAAVETERIERGCIDPATWYWTLTWLEGRPICELDDDTRVTEQADGSIRVVTNASAAPYPDDLEADLEDDDWLTP